MARNRGLGRGLDAIFDDNSIESVGAGRGATLIRISQIEPNRDQPRKQFDKEALSSLADSISANGVLQPIIIRELPNGMYGIIAGERRWRASRLAGLSEIPAIIMDADELAGAKIAMIENLQRENLNPYEEALGYADLIRNYSLTQEEIASQIGKSRSAIANSLRLLELPEEVIEYLIRGDLSAGHGRALLGLKDKSNTLSLAQRAVARNLSVREVETAVRAANRKSEIEEEISEPQVDYIADLEEKASSILGRRCKITYKANKKSVQFDYTDDDDLLNLLTAICGKSPVED